MRKQHLAIVLAALLGMPLGAGAAVIHVPADQPTIRHAMEAAVNGDTVRVADGTWTGFWNKDLDFLGKSITVESENGPAACILDCQNDGRGFIFQSGEDQTAVLQGFTIANGLHGPGGGINCSGASPTIRNMIISGCRATDQGGGIYCEDASPEITDCVVDGCLSDYNGGGLYCLRASPAISSCTISNNDNTEHYPYEGYGGGMACFEGSSPVITETTFAGNHADNHGGGLYCVDSSIVVIRDCFFESNTAEARGGGAYVGAEDSLEITGCSVTGNVALDYGGGLLCGADTGLIADNLIHDNSGGGLRCGGQVLVTGNTITDNTEGSGIDCESSTVTNNIITGNSSDGLGGGISCDSYADIFENTITDNQGSRGGGIYCYGNNIEIFDNLISGNAATQYGGGIYTIICRSSDITNNLIIGNSASTGGGIFAGPDTFTSFINNLVINNSAGRGGGIACQDADPWFWNMTVTGNTATSRGGALFTFAYSHVRVVNSIFWGNSASEGSQVCVSDDPSNDNSRVTIRHSDVEGGQTAVLVEPGCILNWWDGMIDADPLFATGPSGDFYLSHTVAGQPATSPCVDAGDPSAGIVEGTTRTDEGVDEGVADMGYHYPLSELATEPFVVTGLGPGPDNPPRIRVFPPEDGAIRTYAFQAYDPPHHGVNLSCADVDGDLRDEILTGAGPGDVFGPHVRGFDVNGTPLPGLSFLAYSSNRYGVNVAGGDVDGDGFDEVITGAGPGAVFGPHVRGWSYGVNGVVTPMAGVNFFAYGAPQWGVNVAAGDIDGDGFDEIITGAGPGPIYGAHVRGWNVDSGTTVQIHSISYFAYNTPRYGVRVACGDIDGDGIAEIVTAPGPSPAFGTHIRGWNHDGSTLSDMPGVNFFAWPPEEVRYGSSISAGTDLDGDGRDELVVGAGPDPVVDTLVKVFTYDGSGVTLWFSLQAFPDGWTHGANVTAGRF